MRNVILLGATGSIGTQVLDIIRNNENYKLVAFSFGHNKERAREILIEFEPEMVCGVNGSDINELEDEFPKLAYVVGDLGLQTIVAYDTQNPLVINALVGAVGLMPTAVAIENGRDVLLANKETLVIGGEVIMQKAKDKGVKIIPIDSEHSAIFQLLEGKNKSDIKRLLVTASGGSFRDKTREALANVTKEDALNHPNWKMGQKITIDSATMMNKGFELIEAHYLFNIDIEKIIPIMHRESIVHSMIEFNDGAIFAQMGTADMRLPIQYAMEYPRHLSHECFESLDLVKVGTLHFEEVSFERYPLVKCAIDSLQKGKLQCTILNAANEAAVKLFLEEKIKFLEIENIIINALNNPKYQKFNEGDVSIPKIMVLHEMVYNDIYYQNN